MSETYVRQHYGVPARVGGRVAIDGQPGVIDGFDGEYLVVLFDEPRHGRRRWNAHPTWKVEYLPDVVPPGSHGG